MQIRQMAVRAEFQRRGLGRRLMNSVEALLQDEGGVDRIFLNARVSAAGFYARLGYQPAGEIFPEVGIPHQRMEKALASAMPKSKV